MCLAIPMEIKSLDGNDGIVEANGVRINVRLDLIDEPEVGVHVLVHAGYAIQKLDPEEAAATRELFAEIARAEGEP